MSLAYVRKTYRVPVARGRRVEVQRAGEVIGGTITRCTHYVFIRLDDMKHARPYHPTDPCIRYLGEVYARRADAPGTTGEGGPC